ncbi:MAG: hypothetical protein RL129_159 [Actinomycetota bacterium]
MADVAKYVGVSRQLVGLVFRNASGVSAKTAEKIRKAADELGYVPNLAAQSLRRDGSKYIGVAYHSSHSSSDELIPALYKAANANGYRLMLSVISPNHPEPKAVDELVGHRCDGLILVASELSLTKIKGIANNFPLVSLSRRMNGVRCGVVTSKGESGVFDSVEHLVKLGHKSITYISTDLMLDNEFRLEGYKEAMTKSKLKSHVINIEEDYMESAGAIAADRILAMNTKPTAVVCSNDQVALGLFHTLLKAGVKVPQQISIVGFDDTVAKLPFLDLTTVHQDPIELANAAIEDLVARIKGEKYLADTVLTSAKLVIRSSTAKPRSK